MITKSTSSLLSALTLNVLFLYVFFKVKEEEIVEKTCFGIKNLVLEWSLKDNFSQRFPTFFSRERIICFLPLIELEYL
jgi:hypothetical protein